MLSVAIIPQLSVNKSENYHNIFISMRFLMMRFVINLSTISEIWILLFYLVFVYPSGKPIIPHLFCYQGLAVDDYGFALDASDWGILDFLRSIEVIKPLEISLQGLVGVKK
jgi:hypothetical protein